MKQHQHSNLTRDETLSLKPNHYQFKEDQKMQHQHSKISTQNLQSWLVPQIIPHYTGLASVVKMFLLCSYNLETTERQPHTNTRELNAQMYVPGTYKIIPTEVLVVLTETCNIAKENVDSRNLISKFHCNLKNTWLLHKLGISVSLKWTEN